MTELPDVVFVVDVVHVAMLMLAAVWFVGGVVVALIRVWLDRRRELDDLMRDRDDHRGR